MRRAVWKEKALEHALSPSSLGRYGKIGPFGFAFTNEREENPFAFTYECDVAFTYECEFYREGSTRCQLTPSS